MKVVVIGSGMSGLVTAAYLAQAGHSIIIYEQFPTIGGVTASLKQDGFTWDLGPLLLEKFGPGEEAYTILEELGVADKIRVVREDRGIVFPDFSLWKPEKYAGPFWRREELKKLFPEEAASVDSYYRFYEQIMDLMALSRRVEKASKTVGLILKLRMWAAFQRVKPMAKWTAAEVMAHFFKRWELKALFTAILADFVVLPSEFPGLGVPTTHVETSFDKRIPLQVSAAGPRPGYWYVVGGMQRVVDALAESLRIHGARIQTGTTVTKIQVENGEVSGVRLEDGHIEAADLVVASGGARETFYDLLGRKNLDQRYIDGIDATTPMESVLMVHLGVDMDPGRYQSAAVCYYYGTYDIEGGVLRCRNGDYHEGRDGFLVYVPSMHSPEMAPAGHHAVTIYTIAPNKLKKGSWDGQREEFVDKLVTEAERFIPGLRAHTKVAVSLTPEDFQKRTHLARHAFGGIAPVMGIPNPAHRTPVKGLWFVGAQSESGGGVAGVMIGARKVVMHILEENWA
jgi:phytoene dehydrogenase-like protein